MIVLPRPHFSYSQFDLWRKNPSQYRARYYLNQKLPETPEIIFGRHVARLLEDGRRLRKIKRYSKAEHQLDVDIIGVPIMAYLDSFDPIGKRFKEFKTGHYRADGSPPWNNILVRRHDQLPFYSLMIELQYGEVENLCELVWLETRFKREQIEFDGHILGSEGRRLELTGSYQVFQRIIRKWERQAMKRNIIKVIKEISEDYGNFKKNQ